MVMMESPELPTLCCFNKQPVRLEAQERRALEMMSPKKEKMKFLDGLRCLNVLSNIDTSGREFGDKK